MSEEETSQEEETVTEQNEEEEITTEEHSKPQCLPIPESVKPLIDCCRDYEQGNVDEGEVALKALEFMQSVRKSREGESGAEAEEEET